MTEKNSTVFVTFEQIPHYRSAIYEKLMSSPEYRFVILADDKAHWEALQVETPAQHPHWRWIPQSFKTISIFGKGLVVQPKLIKTIIQHRPAAVIFDGSPVFLTTWLGVLLCRALGIKTLSWSMSIRRPEFGFKWFVRKSFNKLFNGNLIFGDWAAEWFISHGFSSDRIWAIHNSLDYQAQLLARKHTVESSSFSQLLVNHNITVPYMVYSGRLATRKRLDLLLLAIRDLRMEGIRVGLVLVGDGPWRNRLQDLAREYCISDSVYFYGECYSEDDLASIFMNAHFSVCPGAVGLMVMHSFAYGTPVLTHTNISGSHGPEFEAVANGITGFLFTEDDVSDLSKKIIHFLKVDVSTMRQNCIDIVEKHYTPDYQSKVIHDALDSLLKHY